MNNLILLRHGQSVWNKEKRFTGFADVELTEDLGKSEAKNAGQLIKKLNIEFDAYFTSRLKRAKNTLEIVLETLNKKNVEFHEAWELNERHYGGLTGQNKESILKKFGEEQVKIWRRSFDVKPPIMELDHPYKNKIDSKITGESLKDAALRVNQYYDKKIKPLLLKNKNVLVVFHGNSCRGLLMNIFNISKEKIIKLEIPTGNPLHIRFENNLRVKDFKYLNKKRAKKILFNI